MKETLAAALLEVAGWRDIAAAGGAFADPMCGSGTIAIEAAMVAGDIAPGLLRSTWGFDRWLGHDEAAWSRLLDAADERCEIGRGDDAADPGLRRRRSGHRDRQRLCEPCWAGGPYHAVPCRPRPVRTTRGVRSGPCRLQPALRRAAVRQGAASRAVRRARGGVATRCPDGRWPSSPRTRTCPPGLGMRPDRVQELYNGKILAPVSVFGPGAAALDVGRRPSPTMRLRTRTA